MRGALGNSPLAVGMLGRASSDASVYDKMLPIVDSLRVKV